MGNYHVFTIDKDDDAPKRAFRFAKDLCERIIEAQNLAFMNEIEANTVVINGRKYGMLKDKPGFVPTVFGMRAETKVDIPDEWDFFLQERPPQPRTNADRIRAMSDEELAGILTMQSVVSPPWCSENYDCPYAEQDPARCDLCALDWLRQEAI